MDVPQSVARFGLPAMARKDKDFMAAFVLNKIVGGGFASRLYEEVREKRGLAYSVYTTIVPFKHASVFVGSVATKNEEIGQSLDLIRASSSAWPRTASTEAELADAKSYLTGSFALRFDTNAKIANQLLWTMVEDLGPDYVDKRNAHDRCRDAGRREARRQAAVRGQGADRHGRRQAQGPDAGGWLTPSVTRSSRERNIRPGGDRRGAWQGRQRWHARAGMTGGEIALGLAPWHHGHDTRYERAHGEAAYRQSIAGCLDGAIGRTACPRPN